MLRTRWRKVLRDVWSNKIRTTLVVLSIAVGVFANGMITASRVVLERELQVAYAAANPADARLVVSSIQAGVDVGFDDDLVRAVRHMREVQEAEGRRRLSVRLRVGPDEWRDVQLIAINDYDDIRINKIWPARGAWPPRERELLIERSGFPLTLAAVGDLVEIKAPNGKVRALRLTGLAHDLTQMPAVYDGTINGYITFDTLEWLGEPRGYNELSIVVSGDRKDRQHIQAVTNRVRDKIEASGPTILMSSVPEPGKPPLGDIVQALFLLLEVLGFFALLLSSFLVINTISAVLTQQVRQIGIMKAIGARAGQIRYLYLVMVAIFGLLALILALPLSVGGARQLSLFLADLLNLDMSDFRVPLLVLGLQIAVGLVMPLLATLPAVFSGTNMTVREAISDYGVGASSGHGDRATKRSEWIARLLAPLRLFLDLFQRPVLLSLRNTFRRKGRLVLTLVTLTLGGAIFISVLSVRASLLATLDIAMQTWRYDVLVTFDRPYRVEKIKNEVLQVDGMTNVTAAVFGNTQRVRSDDTESDDIVLVAVPVESELVKPAIVRGRWLKAGDTNAVVLSANILKSEPDIEVGDLIELKIGKNNSTWQVVGFSQFLAPIAFVSYDEYARVTHSVGRANSALVVHGRHDRASQAYVTQMLEQHFARVGLKIDSVAKLAEEHDEVAATFNILVALLLIMALLMAVVGSLGLMGVMSINVLERTREIGVMRAIGATSGAVLQVVMVEGIVIGLLSWPLGLALSIPLSKVLSDAVGLAVLQSQLSYTFSIGGVVIWLGVVVVLSALASFLPAWSALRLTVRDTLAYQ